MDYIYGKAILEKYSISVGELVKAILDGLPAYDSGTGERLIDMASMIAYPTYKTEEQAAKVVDLLLAGEAAREMRKGEKPLVSSLPDWIPSHARERFNTSMSIVNKAVRDTHIKHFYANSKVYGFPAGQEPPKEPWLPFPLRFETFRREYANDVLLGLYEGESTRSLYGGVIRAMLFPVAAVEARFGGASALEPGQVAPMVGGEAEAKAKPAVDREKRLPVTQKVVSVLCDVTEKQVGKWDKGIQTPDRYPGRYDLDKLKPWAETYQQRRLVASTARAANHPSSAEGLMLENLSDEGSGDPAALYEQNQNRKRKV